MEIIRPLDRPSQSRYGEEGRVWAKVFMEGPLNNRDKWRKQYLDSLQIE